MANGRIGVAPIVAWGVELGSYLGGRVRAPWILELRNDLARGIDYRLIAGDRYIGRQFLADARRRLDAMVPAGSSRGKWMG